MSSVKHQQKDARNRTRAQSNDGEGCRATHDRGEGRRREADPCDGTEEGDVRIILRRRVKEGEEDVEVEEDTD